MGMRDRHASKESSTEPGAIRSIFFVDIVGEPEELAIESLEDLAVAPAEEPLMDGLDELMDGPDEDFISEPPDDIGGAVEGLDEGFVSSLAQPEKSSAMKAITPILLRI